MVTHSFHINTHTDGVWPEPSVSSCGPNVSAPCVPPPLPVWDVTSRHTCSPWKAGQGGYLVSFGLSENVPKYCCSCHLNLQKQNKIMFDRIHCIVCPVHYHKTKQLCFKKTTDNLMLHVTAINSHCLCKQECWPRYVTGGLNSFWYQARALQK